MTPEEAEAGLVLLALLGFEDPPRPDARQAVADCRHAGVAVAMVTGDHPATARAIAEEVGLWVPGAPVLTGDDLPDDDDALGALIDHDGVVLSRVSPEQKLRIAGALQRRGHVVAMTGDGVNDGPALQKADIGVAMGGVGTDVAREAADLVLLDDRFSTVVDAIAQGRAAFGNIRRFLTYHLTDNVAELTPFALWAVSGQVIPLALGVMQVLALDLGTDTFSAVALGAEPPRDGTLDRPPERGRLFDRLVARRAFGVLGPVEAAMEMTAFGAVLVAGGWWFGEDLPTSLLLSASGAAFLTVILAQSANAVACRSASRGFSWSLLTGNRFLLGAVALELAIGLACLLVAPVADALEHAWPTMLGVAIALASMPVLLLADAADKARRRRRGVALATG
jgi:magnesium-transporting ATPase (P-type)